MYLFFCFCIIWNGEEDSKHSHFFPIHTYADSSNLMNISQITKIRFSHRHNTKKKIIRLFLSVTLKFAFFFIHRYNLIATCRLYTVLLLVFTPFFKIISINFCRNSNSTFFAPFVVNSSNSFFVIVFITFPYIYILLKSWYFRNQEINGFIEGKVTSLKRK